MLYGPPTANNGLFPYASHSETPFFFHETFPAGIFGGPEPGAPPAAVHFFPLADGGTLRVCYNLAGTAHITVLPAPLSPAKMAETASCGLLNEWGEFCPPGGNGPEYQEWTRRLFQWTRETFRLP